MIHLVVNEEGELSRYDRRVLKYREHWDLLIPTNGVIQTCGNMGVISLGIGWDYGKRRQWETFVMLGYIPSFDSDDVEDNPHAQGEFHSLAP